MAPKASDLPANTKEIILRQVREQIGSDRYAQLANKLGEEGLINLALEAVEQNNIANPRLKKMGRFGGLIAGFVMGLLVGGVFLGAGWLLNAVLRVPFGYSLAALTNGAIITIPTSILLAWLRKKEDESIDFRTMFSYYILASLVGGLIGVGRWLLRTDVSVMETFVSPLWGMFNSTCVPLALGIGLVIAVLTWIVSLGQSSYNMNDVAGVILIVVVIFLLIVSLIALLADAPLWQEGLPLLKGNIVGVTLVITAGLGGLLGLCWPPVLPENT